MGRLVINGNSVYEIDEECVRKKEQQERRQRESRENREQYPYSYRRPRRRG